MDFDEFIKSQQQSKEETASPEKAKEQVQFFNDRLKDLYKVVTNALKLYINDGSVKISEHTQELKEDELFGCKEYRYNAQETIIQIGKSAVNLTPIGINIIGAGGRVDMDGPRGKATILLARPGGPQIHTAIYSEGQTPLEPPAPTPKEELVWQFMVRLPRLHYIEVNEETFKDTLMQVING
ncbi:hypothetical protein [Psychrobacillus sp. L4]|uniref:hypothetical protein n=1 Tax=Psychrobacillus sp. L4 TaxID=3236892 RepID=UPI0036F1D483